MIIGIPKEIKRNENRVSMTPAGVEVLRRHGHTVLVQHHAGRPSGFNPDLYWGAGAEIVDSPEEIFSRADMILRVKEPQPDEFGLLRDGQIYFSYLHLAAEKNAASALMERGATAIGYETIQTDQGSLPLLKPMSEVAGQMAIQEGAKYLEMNQGGHGVLLGGVPGVDPGLVLIIGGGVVGLNAAKKAAGLGAKVYVLDIDIERLRYLADVMPPNCFALMSNPATIRELLPRADVVVGCTLVPGRRTPVSVTRELLKVMKRGTVMIDVSIDQGGCFETSRETTHSDPIYTEEGIVHYAVSNMPGAVPKTSTLALTNATLPYVLEIADKGWKKAAADNAEIARGVNVAARQVTHPGVAEALDMQWVELEDVLDGKSGY